MSSPNSPFLPPDLDDRVAACLAEHKQRQRDENLKETAAVVGKEIGEEVGKELSRRVGAAIAVAVMEINRPRFDVREQIIANAEFALACYSGIDDIRRGISVVTQDHGNDTIASVVLNNTEGHDEIVALIQGPCAASDTDALVGLLDKSRASLEIALTLREGPEGFINLKCLY